MENRINEAYIDNLSKYMDFLTVNEIFEEIKKVKAFIIIQDFLISMKEIKKTYIKKLQIL